MKSTTKAQVHRRSGGPLTKDMPASKKSRKHMELFPYVLDRTGRRLNGNSNLRVHLGNTFGEGAPLSVEFKFAEALMNRGIIVSDVPLREDEPRGNFNYIWARNEVDPEFLPPVAYQPMAWTELVGWVWKGEVEAAAFKGAKLDPPSTGFPIPTKMLIHLRYGNHVLDQQLKLYTGRWKQPDEAVLKRFIKDCKAWGLKEQGKLDRKALMDAQKPDPALHAEVHKMASPSGSELGSPGPNRKRRAVDRLDDERPNVGRPRVGQAE